MLHVATITFFRHLNSE